MRNRLSLLGLLICSLSASTICQEMTIKDSGFYGVYVKSMPFWPWNYSKVIKMLSASGERSEYRLRVAIKAGMPVAFVWKWQKERYKALTDLKHELSKLGCELDLQEITLTCDEQDDLPSMIELFEFTEPVQKILSEYTPDPNLTDEENLQAQRTAVIDALEKK